MPVDILLDKERRTMRMHAWGYVALADFTEGIEKTIQLIDSGTVDLRWGQIIDLTDVTSSEELSSDDAKQIASLSPWPPGARRAIVVNDDRTRALAYLYQAVGKEKGQAIEVVETIEAAERWVAG